MPKDFLLATEWLLVSPVTPFPKAGILGLSMADVTFRNMLGKFLTARERLQTIFPAADMIGGTGCFGE